MDTPVSRGPFGDHLTIGFDNPTAAEQFYSAIEAKAELLASHPRIGPRRPEVRRSTRILVEGAYLILYETHPDTDDGPVAEVEIVRIVHGRRDLLGLF